MERKFLDIKVKDIMKKDALPIVEKDESVEEVLPFPMGHSHVWVVNDREDRQIVGVITEHDVLDILSPSRFPYNFGLPDMRQLEKGMVEHIMTRDVIKCSVDDTVRDALDKMTKYGIRRLPAIGESEKIEGEINLKHITDKFAEMIKEGK